MKLILLAAGKSSRIFSKININKCLIKINKKSLIKNIIDNAYNSGIKHIEIVSGFKSKNIEKDLKNYNVTFIKNIKYETTDMVYSSILSLKRSKTNVIICYTDIIFEKNIFKSLINKKKANIIVPHLRNWKNVWKLRKKNIFEDAETFLTNKNNNKVIEIGKK